MTVDIDASARELGGLVDGEPVAAGEVVRVCTTGGGGWGDPLEREPSSVLQDVNEDKVSAQAARTDYGVVLRREGLSFKIDLSATEALRVELKQKQIERAPMIDRGPGYLELLR